MPELKSGHLFDLQLTLGAIQEAGPVATGNRTIYVVEGGNFEGPKLAGSVLGGADRVTWISGATQLLDVRLTLETDDRALIYLRDSPDGSTKHRYNAIDVSCHDSYDGIIPARNTRKGLTLPTSAWWNTLLA